MEDTMTFLLPGMGATSRMYGGPWLRLPEAVALDWPDWQGERTIAAVAERLIGEHGIGAEDRLVGSSLGGIVGLEVHRRVGLRQVWLVGSALRREEINSLLTALAPLAEITPLRLIQHLAGKGPSLLSSMFAEVDAEFVRAMCHAIAAWTGYEGELEAIRRIHGERDRVIRCPADAHFIPGAGHLVAMTHAEACVSHITST